MATVKGVASFVLAVNLVPALLAESHCPGNAASVPFRLVNRYQMIVEVSVNHFGPYRPGLWQASDSPIKLRG